MIIISWDVGIIHLAYCVLEYLENDASDVGNNKKPMIKILDWDEINLIEDYRIKLECCGTLKAKKGEKAQICGKNAIYCFNPPNTESVGFCKTHLSQSDLYWTVEDTQMLFRKTTNKHTCGYLKLDGSKCGKTSSFIYENENDTHPAPKERSNLELEIPTSKKLYFCTTHYKSELQKKIKEYSPYPIRNTIAKKYPTSQLQLNLIHKLDELAEHFAKLKIEEVIIENQPSYNNPKMKSISNTLFDYFLFRGYVDKIYNLDIKLVRFMCPSNKLKVNNDNTIEVLGRDKTGKNKYKLTKALGIQYTRQLLKDDPEQLEYLELYKKKDDICDAYLQGRYYLEFIRSGNKKKKSVKRTRKSKSSGSKRTQKSKKLGKKSTHSNPTRPGKNVISL